MQETTDNKNGRILDLRNATVRYRDLVHDDSQVEITLSVQPGELIFIDLVEAAERIPLGDLLCGMTEPKGGNVCFMGEDWQDMSENRSSHMRSRIGRVVDGQAWVHNLTLRENVMLSKLHHTREPVKDIVDDMNRLAEIAGLATVPPLRTDMVNPLKQQQCQWVRAFIGMPDLVILERPERNVPDHMLPRITNIVDNALGNGAAIVWATSDVRTVNSRRRNASRRYWVFESQLTEATENDV